MLLALIEIIQSIGWQHMASIWAVVIFAAVMRAFTGFGFALTAVPVFSLLLPPTQAVVLSASLTLAVSLTTWDTFWGKFPLRSMLPLLLSAAVGTLLGAQLLERLPAAHFLLWIGLLVVLASVVLSLYRPKTRVTARRWGVLAGAVSGVMNGLFAIPGPAVIVYAMATEPDVGRCRALLLTFFMFSAVMALAAYGASGYVTPRSPWLFLFAFPAMYAGDKLGWWLFHRYGSRLHRRVALAVLMAVGLSIMLRALL
jgi:uncharacterized membrane protein YfcA